MKALISLALLLCVQIAAACDDTAQLYVKIGAGYKFKEQEQIYYSNSLKMIEPDPYSARLEIGIKRGNFTYGISHHSQWRTGWPANNAAEPYKTEVFIDYTWTWDL